MLGDLSKRYESASKGSAAIGWDRVGGLSLGEYQIAYRPGTLKRYLVWAKDRYPTIYSCLWPLYPPESGIQSKKGAFAREWVRLAVSGHLDDSERIFIKATHFDSAFKKLPGDLQAFIASSMAAQQVLWSTAVQHGPSGAAKIFKRAWVTSKTFEVFIVSVYSLRVTRFGKHTKSVQEAVRKRFKDEQERALDMLKGES